jgi:hypothetical protein
MREPRVPTAIIQWPHGLDGKPEILPVGQTWEQAEEIRRKLEAVLADDSHEAASDQTLYR